MKKYLFTILFFIGVIGVFTGIMFHINWLDYLCKPLIMISIGGHFLINSKNIDEKIVRIAAVAFLFSLFGDTFLMFTDKRMIYFMLGLVSFLLAQVAYSLLFLRSVKISGNEPFLPGNLFWLIGYLAYGSIVYIALYNHLDVVLKIASFAYMTALLGMSALALNRFKAVNTSSFFLVFAGSVLFVISDSIIAVDKFLTPILWDKLLVMATYIAAQYLITSGILKQFE
jgi:uncharacterized membrane protein YhhN